MPGLLGLTIRRRSYAVPQPEENAHVATVRCRRPLLQPVGHLEQTAIQNMDMLFGTGSGGLKAGNAAGLSLAWIARWPHSVLTIAHFLKGSMQCLPLYCAFCDQAQCHPYHECGLLFGPESPPILGVTVAIGVVRRAEALVLFDVTNVELGTVGTSGTASSTTRLDCPTAAFRSHDVSWSVCLLRRVQGWERHSSSRVT